MKTKELNLHPLQEFLTQEAGVDDIIQHLDNIYHYFCQNSMTVSFLDKKPIEEEEIVCQHWIVRLKQMFEEMKG